MGQYCKFSLLRYKVWFNNSDDAWGAHGDDHHAIINEYQTFLQTDFAIANISVLSRERNYLNKQLSNKHDIEKDDTHQPRDKIIPQFAVLMGPSGTYEEPTGFTDVIKNHDWSKHTRKYTEVQLTAQRTWFKDIKAIEHKHPEQVNSEWKDKDPVKLYNAQREVFDVIKFFRDKLRTGHTIDPKRILVFGTADARKSYLISCIRQLFNPNEILVLAPTGVAARLLGAHTECSALYMPIRNKRHKITDELLQV